MKKFLLLLLVLSSIMVNAQDDNEKFAFCNTNKRPFSIVAEMPRPILDNKAACEILDKRLTTEGVTESASLILSLSCNCKGEFQVTEVGFRASPEWVKHIIEELSKLEWQTAMQLKETVDFKGQLFITVKNGKTSWTY